MWPTLQEIDEEIQNPYTCFMDLQLRSCHPELTEIGFPKPRSGNFSTVYKIQSPTKQWAVKCFSREIQDLSPRYDAITAYLKKTNLPYFVNFEFLHQGILIGGNWYPIVKMEWLDGESLDQFIHRNIHQPHKLMELSDQFTTMMSDLRRWNIAHGDLHHDNILIVNGRLRLIDYDGMFVPALAGKISHEIGHIHYQHPLRTPFDFGPFLDHFPAWNIYITLKALSISPSLWMNHQDDYLLFGREDFLNPESSKLLMQLMKLEDNEKNLHSADWMAFCYHDLTQIPPLVVDVECKTSRDESTTFYHEAAASLEATYPMSPQENPNASWILDHLTSLSFKPRKFSFWPERVSIFAGITVNPWSPLLPLHEPVQLTLLIMVSLLLLIRYFSSPGIKEKWSVFYSLLILNSRKLSARVKFSFIDYKNTKDFHTWQRILHEQFKKLNTIHAEKDQSTMSINRDLHEQLVSLSTRRQQLNQMKNNEKEGINLLQQQIQLKQRTYHLIQEVIKEYEPLIQSAAEQIYLIEQQLNKEMETLNRFKEKETQRIASFNWQIDIKKRELQQLKEINFLSYLSRLFFLRSSRQK